MARSADTPKSSTLIDVAREAGVAPMTVSRFLNQHPNVSAKTAKKIGLAVKKLGYTPNLAARMLTGQSSKAIGLIVPNLADTFFAQVAHSVQDAARAGGLLVWVAASNSDQETEFSLMRQMKQHRVDGILLIPSPGELAFERVAGDAPVVMLDRPIKGSNCDAVLVDNRGASSEAVEHLLAHGHQRILCIGDDRNLFTTAERITGYEDSMRTHGLIGRVILMVGTVDDFSTMLRPIFNAPDAPQAIFTTNNVTSIHVMEALEELGLDIPRDVALIGFDDFELATLTRPSLSAVRQPGADIGRRGARLLLERILAPEDVEAITITLPTTLIQRESCGCERGITRGTRSRNESKAK